MVRSRGELLVYEPYQDKYLFYIPGHDPSLLRKPSSGAG